LVILFLGLLLANEVPALANNGQLPASPSFDAVENLTSQILEKEMELYRINTYFKLQNNKSAPGRRVRMLIYQNINYACTFTGLMVNVIYNFQWYRRLPFHTGPKFTSTNPYKRATHIPSQKIPVGTQFGATMPRLVGKFILINGVLAETGVALWQKHKEKKGGFDLATTDKRVLSLRREINNLSVRRSELIMTSVLSPAERSLALADSSCLARANDLSVQEYAKLHSRSVAASTYNRFDTVLTIGKKSDGDFGADVVRLIGAGNHDGALSSVASISTTTSGAMSAWDPVVCMIARGVAKSSAHRNEMGRLGVPKRDGYAALQQSVNSYKDLSGVISQEKEPVLAGLVRDRSEMFNNFGTVFSSMNYVDERADADQKKHDKHSLIMHQIYGTSKYSRGAWLIYVGRRYEYYPHHDTYLTACAGIINFSGSAIRMADTLHTDAIEVFQHTKLKAKRSVSAVILQGRLNTLDEMEEHMNMSVQAKSVPKALLPDSSTPVSSTPDSSTPVSSTPDSSTPVSSTPDSSTPVSSTPDSSTPVSSTPDSSTPVSSTPDSSTPDSSTPVSLAPASSAPEMAVPASTITSTSQVSNVPASADSSITIPSSPLHPPIIPNSFGGSTQEANNAKSQM
jgi:hypothetical protein